jgi:hypothetical protein
VIGRDTDVRITRLDDLKHALQNADNRAVWPVDTFVETPQSVEVTEQLVSAVDEVNDQFASFAIIFALVCFPATARACVEALVRRTPS